MQALKVTMHFINLYHNVLMYLHEDKCTAYLEHHFVFNKGNPKLVFPNKDLLLSFWFPHDDFVVVFEDVSCVKIVRKRVQI